MSEWPHLPDDAVTLDNNDNYVFHGLGTTIRIFDKNLNSVKNFDIPSKHSIQAVLADGDNDRLYVAAGKSGVFIYDYSDTDNIDYIGVIDGIADDPGFVNGKPREYIIAASITLNDDGGTLYIADNGYGFRVINVSNPENITYNWGCRNDGESDELTTGGFFDLEFFSFNGTDYLAVLDLYYGLKIFDVSDSTKDINSVNLKKPLVSENSLITNPPPSDPEIEELKKSREDPSVSAKDLRTSFYGTTTLARDLKVKEIGSDIYIFITDRSASEEKAAVAKLKLTEGVNILSTPETIGRNDDLLKGNSVDTDGDYIFISDGAQGLQIVDTRIITGQTNQGVDIYGTKYNLSSGYSNSYSVKYDDTESSVFMGDLSEGLAKIDISTPSSPSEDNPSDPFSSFTDIAKNGNTVCALNKESQSPGFLFFNVSDKSDPTLIKKINETNPLFVSNFSTTFAAVTNNQLIVFQNISNDTKESQALNNNTVQSMAVYGSYIYLGTDSGIDIYNYQSSTLSYKTTIENTESFQSLFVDNASKTLFAGSGNLLKSFNINNPAAPVDTGLSFDCTNEIKDIYAANSNIFASSGNFVFTLNKTNLTQINKTDVKTPVNTVFTDEEFLFAGTSQGIKVYSGANGASPTLLLNHRTKGDVSKIILSGSHVYSADSTGGISISEYDKTAGSGTTPLDSKGGDSSCFINSLF
jgi:hypothetical protein